jgi:hypothetical protein
MRSGQDSFWRIAILSQQKALALEPPQTWSKVMSQLFTCYFNGAYKCVYIGVCTTRIPSCLLHTGACTGMTKISRSQCEILLLCRLYQKCIIIKGSIGPHTFPSAKGNNATLHCSQPTPSTSRRCAMVRDNGYPLKRS